MSVENGIRVIAGSFVLASVTLAYFVAQAWLLLAAFVGLNLIQSAFTGFCPAELLLKKIGFGQPSCCCEGGCKSC